MIIMSKLKLTKRDFNEVSNIIMKLFPEFQDELFEELDPNRQNLHGLFQEFYLLQRKISQHNFK